MSVTQRALLVIVLAALVRRSGLRPDRRAPARALGRGGLLPLRRARPHDGWPGLHGRPRLAGLAVADRRGPGDLRPDARRTCCPTTSTQNFIYAGLDGRWNLRHADERVVPFLLTGVGYGTNHCTDTVAGEARARRGQRRPGRAVVAARLAADLPAAGGARLLLPRARDATGFSNHLAATLGLTRAVAAARSATRTWTACATGSTSARTRRSAPRWTRTAARWTATATRSSTASTSARTRPRAARWTRPAARPTRTATACATGWTSARTRRRARRWTRRAARAMPTATASSTASTSARTRRRAATWTARAARRTRTATACATAWTSARTPRPASRRTRRAARSR